MINDLDQSLTALLTPRLPGGTIISFDPPDKNFMPNAFAVDLFLYEIRQNRELAERQPTVVQGASGRATLRPAPVRIDCAYLVTAWGRVTADEHVLLSRIARTLLAFPALPESVLVGEMLSQPTSPTAMLGPSLLPNPGEFWQAMGGRPKAALSYVVTIAMAVFDETEVPVVTTPVNRIEQRV